MPYQKVHFTQGHFYHIYNRGVNRQTIYFSRDNYLYCLKLVQKYSQHYHISVIAYCLMPNHYHLLLRQDGEDSISQFMQQTFKAYVQALNKQQHRVGALFQNRFRAVEVEDADSLVYLCRYIHRNPVKSGLTTQAEAWEFSNFRDWIGERRGRLLDKRFIDDLFPDIDEYIEFVAHDDDTQTADMLKKYNLD